MYQLVRMKIGDDNVSSELNEVVVPKEAEKNWKVEVEEGEKGEEKMKDEELVLEEAPTKYERASIRL